MSHLRLDPTHPSRWREQQARGRVSFQIRYGVLGVGLPLAILFDVTLLVFRRDLSLLLTTHHVLQLGFLCIAVAPLIGAAAGRVLWQVGERRFGDHLLTREFLGDSRNSR